MRGIASRVGDIRTMDLLFPTTERLARDEGVELPGPEHLLLAALDLPDGSGNRALARVGLTAQDLSGALADVHAGSLRSVGIDPAETVTDAEIPPGVDSVAPFRMQATADEMFRRVVARVRQDGARLYGAYFVLDAAEEARGSLGRALDRLDDTRAQLAEAARAELAQVR